MKETMKKIVDAFVSNASKDGRISSDAIGTIASTWTIALALTFGLVGAAKAETITTRVVVSSPVTNTLTTGATYTCPSHDGNGGAVEV